MYILTQALSTTFNKIVEENLNEFTHQFFNSLKTGQTHQNYFNLINGVNQCIKSTVQDSIGSLLESIDLTYRNSIDRKNNFYVKATRKRTLWTVVGVITYTRTIYQNKRNKVCFCYVDELIGIPKYVKFDPSIRALIHQRSAETNSLALLGKWLGQDCFGSLGQEDAFISRQSIRNILKKAPVIDELPKALETPETLYIMADEKYVSTQGNKGKKQMVKCAISYEERLNPHSKRPSLSHKTVFASMETNFWEDFLNQLEKRYDYEKIKKIVIMGDGASWIKMGTGILNIYPHQSLEFHLDHFHYQQALHKYTKDKDLKEQILDTVINLPYKDAFRLLKGLYTEDLLPSQIKGLDYIIKHIKDFKKGRLAHTKCSMEGHISHELASIFSSIPKGYSLPMLNTLIKLRTAHRNHINIFNHSFKQSLPNNPYSLLDFDYSIFDIKKDQGYVIPNPELRHKFYLHTDHKF